MVANSNLDYVGYSQGSGTRGRVPIHCTALEFQVVAIEPYLLGAIFFGLRLLGF
jgi:hypothetical protein